MADGNIDEMKVAILVTDGFEQVEMTEPRKALDWAGAETRVVSLKDGRIKAWMFKEWVDEFSVDVPLSGARPEDFDALLLSGDVINPDKLLAQPEAIAFAKAFFDAGKPVASICHGPLTIIEAGAARGRRLTFWPSLKTDPENAGAEWVDQDVVVNQGLVTSLKLDDIPAFNPEVIKLFASAREQSRQAAAE